MKFEVPQFIDIEDRIFGPLTWKQFLYLGGGIGMGVVLFIVAPFIVFLLVGLPLALLAGALAFYPINNRPFSAFMEAIFNYLGGEKFYVWKQKEEIIHKNIFTPNLENQPNNDLLDTKSKKTVASLARRLELEALQKKQ